jgi:CBS domain-containing protein
METALRRVSEIMQSEVATLGASERLDLAQDVMNLGRVRHLPVLDGVKLVGIVSQRDLLAASLSRTLDFGAKDRRSFLRSIEVAEVMTRTPITLEPDATLRDAATLMLRHKIGCLPVVKPDRTLVGLVTEADLLRAAFLPPESQPDTAARGEEKEGDTVEWKEQISEEITDLRRIRDELAVKVHLAKADARESWQQLEHSFIRLEAKARQISQLAEEPLADIREAARLLIDEIREGYRRIRRAL